MLPGLRWVLATVAAVVTLTDALECPDTPPAQLSWAPGVGSFVYSATSNPGNSPITPNSQVTLELSPEALQEHCPDHEALVAELWDLTDQDYVVGAEVFTQRPYPLLLAAHNDTPCANVTVATGIGHRVELQPKPHIEPGAEYVTLGTLLDDAAWALSRPYHRIILPRDFGIEPPPAASDPLTPWGFTVLNAVSVEPNLSGTLVEWELRVSCLGRGDIHCPHAGHGAGPCGVQERTGRRAGRCEPVDNGQAVVATGGGAQRGSGGGSDVTAWEGYCACELLGSDTSPEAYADIGCQVDLGRDVLLPDTEDTPVAGKADFTLGPQKWAHYLLPGSELRSATGRGAVLIELQRISGGDPFVFAKPVHQGWEPFGLPTSYDFNRTEHLTHGEGSHDHYRLVMVTGQVMRHGIYVSVFNFASADAEDGYTKPAMEYKLRVRTSPDVRDAPLCPLDCNGGTCGAAEADAVTPWECTCTSGFTGPTCGSEVRAVEFDEQVDLVLAPGDWSYLVFGATGKEAAATVRVDLRVRGGNPVLLSPSDHIPTQTYRQADIIPVHDGGEYFRARFRVPQGVPVYLSLHNILSANPGDASHITVKLSVVRGGLWVVSTYVSIAVGGVVSVLVCLCLSLCKRLMVRRRGGVSSSTGLNRGIQVMHLRAREQGVPAKTIEDFPIFTWQGVEEGHSQREVASEEASCSLAASPIVPGGEELDGDATEGPSCSVCIAEYEIGDVLRRLPCQHVFHVTCIDEWMKRHTSCPVCRTELVPVTPPAAQVTPAGLVVSGPAEPVAREDAAVDAPV